MGRACITSIAATFLAFLTDPLLAQLVDGGGKIATQNAVYTIVIPRDDPGSPWCVYRNGKKIFCPEEQAEFGIPIKTKDYELIPLTKHLSGSGQRWWDYSLIIERGEDVAIKTVIDNCFEASCEIKAAKVNYQANSVLFDVGRSNGFRVTSLFNNGALSLKKTKLDPKEPLDDQTCKELFDVLQGCGTLLTSSKEPNCPAEYSGASQATHFFFVKVENEYPGFSRKRFDQACQSACSSRSKVERMTFNRSFCRKK